MKIRLLSLLFVVSLCSSLTAQSNEPFTADWKSLERHTPVPDWMRDAKFGIYCHWGVYSVPAYGNEQYYYYMHRDSTSEDFLMGGHKRHVEMWGPLDKFGYHDFIPMFKAEKFNAEEWATLFKESGAKFAGTVAEHHDGFSMWDSKYTPFNAKKMGPKRDVIGELEKAIKGRGLKFFTSLHHENNYTYIKVKPGWAAYNKKYEKLYGCLMDHNEWLQMWLDKSKEVVSKYSPDIVYFDAWMDQIPEKYKLEFLAHYFNKAQADQKDVIFTYKYKEFPRSIGMLDHEMANPKEIDPIPWLCDYTIADGYHRAWGYVKGMELRTHKDIIHRMVEVVANNGQFLLNLSPMADGTFPQDQKDIVANVGVWMWSYGESIYGTRPYVVSGETTSEGYRVFYTTKENDGIAKDGNAINTKDAGSISAYGNGNKKTKSIYAIFLEWPGKQKPILLTKLNEKDMGGKVKKATLLSVKQNYDVKFSQTGEGLVLNITEGRMPSDVAQVVRLDLE